MVTGSGHYATPSRPSFRFRSQHIPLSRSLALQGFFPQQIVILSLQRVAITQPLFTSPQAITIVSSQPSHHMVGHYNRYIQKTFQFFSPFSLFLLTKKEKSSSFCGQLLEEMVIENDQRGRERANLYRT